MRTIEKVFEYELPIRIKQEKGGYFAYSPIWNDCYAQGDSIDEVSTEITAVAQTLIEIYREEGLVIPLKKVKERIMAENISLTLPVLATA